MGKAGINVARGSFVEVIVKFSGYALSQKVRVRFSAMPFFLVTLAILIILLLNASFA
jgi:hypothetical protein